MSIELLQLGIIQGLILSFIAFGIMIPFRFLNFPDLSVEGAYPCSAAMLTGMLIHGYSLLLAFPIAILGAIGLSILVAQLSFKLHLNSLLAGIIVSTMSFSINLRILNKPNVSLLNISHLTPNITQVASSISLCAILFFIFLKSDFGLRFRAVGLNPTYARLQGISPIKYTLLGMTLSGILYGLAGGFMVLFQQFMDINMGFGIVIHGLVSLLLGETLVGTQSLTKQILAPIIGSLIYQQIQGLILSIGIPPSDLKLFTALMVLIILGLPRGSRHA